MDDKVKVSVFCIVYNHAKYIRECLDGLVMQKTTFPFEVIVHDDCSTDGSAEIIREYQERFPDIIKPILQTENQYSKGIRSIMATFMLPKASGEYLAICEGDDYWIDENKLQLQVEFLDKNADYGMCYTYVKKYIQNQNLFDKVLFGSKERSFRELLEVGNNIPTLSTCFRKTLFCDYINEIKPQEKGWRMGDYPLWLYISFKSRLKFFNIVTGVYRVLENSASHSDDSKKIIEFQKSAYIIRRFFAERFGVKIENKDDERCFYFEYYLSMNNRVECKLLNSDGLSKKYKIIHICSQNCFFWVILKFGLKIHNILR